MVERSIVLTRVGKYISGVNCARAEGEDFNNRRGRSTCISSSFTSCTQYYTKSHFPILSYRIVDSATSGKRIVFHPKARSTIQFFPVFHTILFTTKKTKF